jgi:hypothetical protein
LSIDELIESVNRRPIASQFARFDKNGAASLSTGENKAVEVPSGVRKRMEIARPIMLTAAAIKNSAVNTE